MSQKIDYKNWYMGASITSLVSAIVALFLSFIPCFGTPIALCLIFNSLVFIIVALILAYNFNHPKGIIYISIFFLLLSISVLLFQFNYINDKLEEFQKEEIQKEINSKGKKLPPQLWNN